jgi:hypothetical protein
MKGQDVYTDGSTLNALGMLVFLVGIVLLQAYVVLLIAPLPTVVSMSGAAPLVFFGESPGRMGRLPVVLDS